MVQSPGSYLLRLSISTLSVLSWCFLDKVIDLSTTTLFLTSSTMSMINSQYVSGSESNVYLLIPPRSVTVLLSILAITTNALAASFFHQLPMDPYHISLASCIYSQFACAFSVLGLNGAIRVKAPPVFVSSYSSALHEHDLTGPT